MITEKEDMEKIRKMKQLKPIEINLMRDKRDLFLEECINLALMILMD